MPLNIENRQQKVAAVVVMHEMSTDSLILTKRSDKLRNHPGEISFPGGAFEELDKDFYHTALRELKEELGIDSSRIELIKALEPEHTLLGHIIHPWLVRLEKLEPYQIDPNEVAEVFSLPMTEVVKALNYKKLRLTRSNIHITSIQFTATEYFVWGATARIMRQLVVK